MKKALYFSLLLVLFYTCKKSDLPADNTPHPEADPVLFNVKKNTILQLVNAVRQSGCTCGTTVMKAVAPITWNDQLGKAAYDHSVDMKTNNYFDHNTPTGITPGQRITAAGYAWSAFGENIALGYTTEAAVMDGWLHSEGHCKNIMNESFKEMGVGKEGNYWTQVFGTHK